MKFISSIKNSKKINKFAKEFIHELPCDIIDPQDFCMNCFLDMIRGTAETITDLMKRRRVKDSQILLRTQIERFIKLKKICDDSSYAQKFINKTQARRLKYMQIAMDNGEEAHNNRHYQALKNVIKPEEYEQLKEEVDQQDPEPSVWYLAKETGLLVDHYSTGFRFFSEVTHCDSAELDDCFFLEKGEIVLIPYGSRNCEDLIPTILYSNYIMLESLSIVSQIKKIDIANKLMILRK